MEQKSIHELSDTSAHNVVESRQGKIGSGYEKSVNLRERLGLASLLVQSRIPVILIGEFGTDKTGWAQSIIDTSLKQLPQSVKDDMNKVNVCPVALIPCSSLAASENGITEASFMSSLALYNMRRLGELNPYIPRIIILDEITDMTKEMFSDFANGFPNNIGGIEIPGNVAWVATSRLPLDDDMFSYLNSRLPQVIRDVFIIIPLGQSIVDERGHAESVSDQKLECGTEWVIPSLPSPEKTKEECMHWASLIMAINSQTEYSRLTPNQIIFLSLALGVISAAGEPYNSDANISMVIRATLGMEIGNELIKLWSEMRECDQKSNSQQANDSPKTNNSKQTGDTQPDLLFVSKEEIRINADSISLTRKEVFRINKAGSGRGAKTGGISI